MAIISTVWIVLGLVCAAQIYFKSVLADDGAVTVTRALKYALPIWMIWIPATYGVIGLCRRYHFGKDNRLESFFIHLLGSFGFALLHMVFHAWWLLVRYSISVEFKSMSAQTIHLLDDIWLQLDLLVYWGIVGAYFSLNYYAQNRKREIHNLQMESQLNEAKLTALKAQIHPHFLFNTLSAIQTMVMKKGTSKAVEMITKLSNYLRLTLEENSKQVMTLAKELDFVKHYLAIEKYRFGDRLDVKYSIDKETYDLILPSFLLQPIVENAIKHGLAPKEGKMLLEVSAKMKDSMLEIRILDDGAGKQASNRHTLGTGLQHTEERLQKMYGSHYSFDFSYPETGGFLVTIKIPTLEEKSDTIFDDKTVTSSSSSND
ncbi:sensor histidine kinase [Fodinibius salsisoli]|uniref:Histidine kinase n=1 Tax=Fodinibius salsisoli TaxID=2820877 RepID=A0ABT3PMW6_9BACT|nr:histidine kinase [Fodinibius salsisoli]MCW9707262.1 histidine kinase [Fodinibius salsisoli]